ncbi:hypothetical protein EHF33_20865 (plasmid) [Deinococcus psychrotolerans]|uniref:Uncharacterized protein n=1 Tax=Deinococcus psychrotolerans TaxID=2489213 RepID=A0A3G8YKF2_9DEIO|nr:hypothetical protein [Deinococcus psychrotolerans]AZI45365.1 hypothetical protein EHF33_20865 [Deinococcus psychrotolerans]
MSGIIRIEHDRDRPYVVVSKTLSEDTRLSFALRGVLVYLLGKPDGWTTYMTQVEKSGKEGREAIAAIFVEGRKFGYIQTTARREKGKFVYEHTIHERPLDKPVPMIVEQDGQPHTANRKRQTVSGKPDTVSRVLVSNNLENNQEHVIKEREEQAAPPPPLAEPEPSENKKAAQPTAESETPLTSPEAVQTPPLVGSTDAQSPKKVPGGAAGEAEAYLRRKLSSTFVTRVLGEIQPLGVDRQEWFTLPLIRIEELAAEAQRTHLQHSVKVPTRMRDLLDEAVRRQSLQQSSVSLPELALAAPQARRTSRPTSTAEANQRSIDTISSGLEYLKRTGRA